MGQVESLNLIENFKFRNSRTDNYCFYGGILSKPFETFPKLGSLLFKLVGITAKIFWFRACSWINIMNPYIGDTYGVLTFTQGGVQSIEAYLNFGFFGSFIIPFLF